MHAISLHLAKCEIGRAFTLQRVSMGHVTEVGHPSLSNASMWSEEDRPWYLARVRHIESNLFRLDFASHGAPSHLYTVPYPIGPAFTTPCRAVISYQYALTLDPV